MTKSRDNVGKAKDGQNIELLSESVFIPLTEAELRAELDSYAKLELLRSVIQEWLRKIKANEVLLRDQVALSKKQEASGQPKDYKQVEEILNRSQADVVILKRLQIITADHLIFIQEQRNLKAQIKEILQRPVSIPKEEKPDKHQLVRNKYLERAPLFFQPPTSVKSKSRLPVIHENKKPRLK
jgi:hypothetical protein